MLRHDGQTEISLQHTNANERMRYTTITLPTFFSSHSPTPRQKFEREKKNTVMVETKARKVDLREPCTDVIIYGTVPNTLWTRLVVVVCGQETVFSGKWRAFVAVVGHYRAECEPLLRREEKFYSCKRGLLWLFSRYRLGRRAFGVFSLQESKTNTGCASRLQHLKQPLAFATANLVVWLECRCMKPPIRLGYLRNFVHINTVLKVDALYYDTMLQSPPLEQKLAR